MGIPQEHRRELDERGFVRLPGFIAPARRQRLVDRIEALFAEEGDHAGGEFKQEPGARRLANLVDKGEVFVDCVVDAGGPGVRGPRARNGAQAEQPERALRESAQRRRAAAARGRGRAPRRARLLGLQHGLDARRRSRPTTGPSASSPAPTDSEGGRRTRSRTRAGPHPDEVLVTGEAGDLVVMNSHLWHGGTANRTDRARLALHAFYCRRDKPQQQYQKALLRAETQSALSATARDVLALDDPMNDALAAKARARAAS